MYGLRRLQVGRCGELARTALLAPDCCPRRHQKCLGNQFSSLCDIFWLVTAQKRGGIRKCCLFVRTVRLELTQANAHYPLKVACLPFHHVRITLRLQSYAEFIYLQIFRPKNPIFPPVSVLPSSRTPLSSHPPCHPASFLVGARLLDLGGTRALVHAAWYREGLADEPNGMCAAFRTGKPGVPNGMWRTRLLFGNVASPVQSSFLGIVPVGVYSQICILKKYCHADCGRGTSLKRVRIRRSQNPCWGARAPDGRRTLVGARTQTAGAGHFEARTDGANLRRTTRQVLLNQR